MLLNRHPADRPPLIGPILCFGFLTATLMFCAWYILHFPGVFAPSWVGGGVLLLILCIGMAAAGLAVGSRRAWKVGLGAGLLAASLDLIVLGSFLAEAPPGGTPAPGFSGLRPQASVFIPGFLALGAAVGLLAAAAGGRLAGAVRSRGVRIDNRVRALEAEFPVFWLSRFAIVAVATIAPLLLSGGGVTSTQSGMAVPGWPDSYGANMFLYPISLMTGRVFFEHSHRLFGALAGLTVLVLMVYTLVSPTTRKARLWAGGLFIFVCIQGWLGGGGRVNLNNPYLGALHGIAAQLFFAGAVALAAGLSPLYRPGTTFAHDPRDRRRKALSTGLLHATILQLALGAAFRHLKATGNPGSSHILFTHAAFSLVVVILAMLAGFALLSRAGGGDNDPIGPTVRRIGRGILASVAFQFALGWLAFWLIFSGDAPAPTPTSDQIASATAPPIDVPRAVVTTLHQANGALLLALATLAVVWSRRIWRDREAALPQRAVEMAR